MLNTDFLPYILLTTDFLPYILLTTVKIGLITDFETRILLITDFGLELLLITDFGGTPLRPSFLWRSKKSYNELIARISVGCNKDVCPEG